MSSFSAITGSSGVTSSTISFSTTSGVSFVSLGATTATGFLTSSTLGVTTTGKALIL